MMISCRRHALFTFIFSIRSLEQFIVSDWMRTMLVCLTSCETVIHIFETNRLFNNIWMIPLMFIIWLCINAFLYDRKYLCCQIFIRLCALN